MQEILNKIWTYQENQSLSSRQKRRLEKIFIPIKTRIYDRDYILNIRTRPDTIVVDLDGTLLIMSKETKNTYLRLSLFRAIKRLKTKRKVRLVLWSAALQDYVRKKLEQYPQLIDLFDEIITAENYRINPEILESSESRLEEKKLRKFYQEILETADFNTDREKIINKQLQTALKRAISFRKRFDEGKNLSLINYQLLIDNAPSVRTQAMVGGHLSLHIPTIDWNYITPANIPRIYKFEKCLSKSDRIIIEMLDNPVESKNIIRKFQNRINRFTRVTRQYGKIFFLRKYV